MLTNKDVQKLIEVFATKEDLRDATENLATREDIHELQKSVDAYAKKADTYFQEMAAFTSKMNRLERWIQEVADKVGVELKS